MQNREKKLVFLGVGQVARAVAAGVISGSFFMNKPDDLKDGCFSLYGTTRSAQREEELRGSGINPVVIESYDVAKEQLRQLMKGAYVVVSFPPDRQADVAASLAASDAAAIAYISSTAVYGKFEGTINESTPVDREAQQAKARLEAEEAWLKAGASVIRAPGIYGGGSGLHKRLIGGTYRLPGDGSNYVSRIHVDDLAAIIWSCLRLLKKSQIFLSGDELPTTHREVVDWLVGKLNLPFPPTQPLDECHYTQRGNRKVEAQKSRNELGVQLRYPTYKEGYSHELSWSD